MTPVHAINLPMRSRRRLDFFRGADRRDEPDGGARENESEAHCPTGCGLRNVPQHKEEQRRSSAVTIRTGVDMRRAARRGLPALIVAAAVLGGVESATAEVLTKEYDNGGVYEGEFLSLIHI